MRKETPDPKVVLILTAIVAPWYLYAYLRHGQDFIDGFIMRHNVQRFSGSLEGHGGSAFYYLLAVPLLLLPWSGLFIALLAKIRAGFGDPLQRFLWLWFAFVLGFFSLSGTKLPHYVLYGCTPLFVLIGLHAQSARRAWPHLILPGLLFVLFPLLPNLFDALARSTLGDGFYRAQLGRAFEVADTTYIAATITGLINGASPAALSDGIRVERAANTAGTSWQQVRMFPRFTRWSWKWDGAQLLNRIVVSGTSYAGSNTRDTFETGIAGQTTNKLAGQQGTKRLFTWAWTKNDNLMGFSYGKGAPTGSTSATANLWQRSSSSYPIPFTRVWLRPRLGNALAFPAAPVGGYPAAPKPAGLKDRSELAPWGVTGIDHTGEANVEPWNTNVLAIESSSTRVYVGGRFTGVKQGPTGTVTAQRSLAAFDLDGNWISTFRPTIVGRVWDLALTPDGKLIIAGDFSSVNGNTNARGLAALDPTTGQLLTTWKARTSRVGGTEWRVRTIDVRNGWVYAAGTFDRVVTPSNPQPVAVTNAMSLATANGALGPWKPTPNGGVFDLAVTNDATRVLLAGNFASVGGSTTHGFFGITSTANGSPVAGAAAWKPSDPTRAKYQQAVADLGDRLLVGGSEHTTQLWNKARTSLLDASITKPGGDTQVIEVVGTKAYVGCHCGGWIYHGTNVFPMPPSFRAIDSINLIGAWDTATWTYDTSWYPSSLKGASGEGIWAIEPDVRGCLWVGGDLDRGAYSGNAATDWLAASPASARSTPPPPPRPGPSP